jgi:hypothetical protein
VVPGEGGPAIAVTSAAGRGTSETSGLPLVTFHSADSDALVSWLGDNRHGLLGAATHLLCLLVSHVVRLGMDIHDRTYHVMQPVRTFGLLALVFFLVGSADEDDGLLALLLGSTLERLE